MTREDSTTQRRRCRNSSSSIGSESCRNPDFIASWEEKTPVADLTRSLSASDIFMISGVRMNDQGLHQELNEIKEELKEKRDILRMAFLYASMSSGPASSGSVFQLSLSQWMAFAQECHIVDAKSNGVKSTDLVRMFVSTNFEEDSKTEEAEANDDDALVRFEFLEILVRASFGKYITSKQLSDSSDSVKRLLEQDIIPNLAPEGMLDPNVFRKEKLYTAEMEKLIKDHLEFLTATFKLYKAKDKTKYFAIEHWMAFLESTSLLGPHTGMEKCEAKLMFAWSQMTVIDELKKRHRAICFMFFDFIEALARIAERMATPSDAEMAGALPKEMEISSSALVFTYYSHLKNNTLELPTSKESRTLPERFHQLLCYLIEALRAVWGGNTKEQVTDRMRKMASRLSGGIELG